MQQDFFKCLKVKLGKTVVAQKAKSNLCTCTIDHTDCTVACKSCMSKPHGQALVLKGKRTRRTRDIWGNLSLPQATSTSDHKS